MALRKFAVKGCGRGRRLAIEERMLFVLRTKAAGFEEE
jgi:hypothetical protein